MTWTSSYAALVAQVGRPRAPVIGPEGRDGVADASLGTTWSPTWWRAR
ncbi:hypothetical protein ABZ797_03145 [Streptomyces antimycoticus]|nr:hypothetical protein [Streptomyces antimycoticus]WJE02500.1 hypothetical protein QR300_39170 [Streptomyces antimycoticus]